MRTVVLWVVLGLAGLVLAGGAAVGVMHLTGQDAGLAGEPLDAGNELLAPPVMRTVTVVPKTTTQRTEPVTVRTVPVTPAPPAGAPAEPGRDGRGSGGEREREPSGDDD